MTAAGQDRLARAAAALRIHLPATSDDELRALARVALDAAAEPVGQDGERLVTDPRDAVYDELVAGALAGICPDPLVQKIVDRARAAVAPDLDRAGYDRARRECAETERRLIKTTRLAVRDSDRTPDEDRYGRVHGRAIGLQEACDLLGLPNGESSSGRAPAGEEGQR